MPQRELHQALAELHRELETAETISEEDREALLQAMREIRDTLESTVDTPESAEGPLSGRLSSMIARFESTHPEFAEMLQRLSEGLANIGI